MRETYEGVDPERLQRTQARVSGAGSEMAQIVIGHMQCTCNGDCH